MTSKETISILRYIAEAYPHFDITEQRVAVWIEQLKAVNYEKAFAKLKKHVSQCKFPPTISEIYVQEEKSRVNRAHLEKMRKLRGEDFYERYYADFGNEVQY
ncbi:MULTISPECIES: replicative helicase loader/inhibitor [Priestia]|jgi:Loader and inhibitor of phage G40P|uniref:replicative helicase loader/inhibitor n=1 Tax=Priestia TaxID=2800373 RepID=UPI00077C3987|nr:replicative helicase loader/inhibitor [Priestia flexa]AQX55924.1 hypothetical protein BC359_17510 [Priestia flexa]MCG7314118.1 replicative helicase loader/inhibitor [Priestia flexa]MCM3066818.1 replicative helicase loader/inhibitor [Priestia flexa]MED4589451.1 replicative helicase loader/inhibitor [Priestia flexa]